MSLPFLTVVVVAVVVKVAAVSLELCEGVILPEKFDVDGKTVELLLESEGVAIVPFVVVLLLYERSVVVVGIVDVLLEMLGRRGVEEAIVMLGSRSVVVVVVDDAVVLLTVVVSMLLGSRSVVVGDDVELLE